MQRQTEEKTRNWWKTGFLTLIGVLVVGLVVTLFMATRPVKVESTASSSMDTTNINVTLNKQQVNALADYYVNKSLKNSTVKYRFQVADHAMLTGSTEVLGAHVNFSLMFNPTVLPNGDVKLTAQKLAIGSLPVPVSFVLNYVAKNYPLPKWVAMDSGQKTMTLHLTAIGNGKKLSYAAKQINLSGQGKFVFQARIPQN